MDDKEREAYERAIANAETNTSQERIRNMQQEVMINAQDKSMIKDQLDLGEELDRIDYLLRGYVIDRDPETKETTWMAPEDNEMIILSDFGVHLIRNTIAWYLNKNTLLSNYDAETIDHKMEDFANDLNDTIFMEYEKIFQYPTFEDCKKILDDRIRKKTDLRVYSLEILGKKLNEKEKEKVYEDFFMQIEPVIEREITKIKEQVIKNKLKRFMLIIREVQDAVHSTYLRALQGQERRSLREHMTISETKGGMGFQPQPQGSNINPMNWIRGRK